MGYYYLENTFTVKSINSIFKRNYENDYFYSGESHNFWELVYVEKGRLTVSENEDVYELCEGQIIFHSPMEFHRFWASRSEKPVFRIISFSLDCDFEHNLGSGVFSLDIDLQKQFMDVYTQIASSIKTYGTYDEVTAKENDSPAKMMLAAKKLESFLLSVISGSSPEQVNDFSVAAGRYKDVVNYMSTNIYKALCLDDIANGTHFSASYIKKLFSMYAGCGVMHYFTRMKIVSSLTYIRRGDSISEISEMFSFSSPNYFSAVFKREMGMLPSEYRHKDLK